jgi:hypothetical protein
MEEIEKFPQCDTCLHIADTNTGCEGCLKRNVLLSKDVNPKLYCFLYESFEEE